MKVKNIAKNTVSMSFKLLWAGLCYLFAGLLAIASAYFTVMFYSDGSKENDIYIMAFLAISLEGIKLIFSIGYPYLRGRNKKNEKTVLLTLKICFLISILSSVYYLLLGSNIEKSPASRTVAMLYEYVPILNIIPLNFVQFLATVSLSLIVEFFIIYLPIIAPSMFYEKKSYEKHIAISNFEKLKEIIVVMPNIFINRLHQKVLTYANNTENDKSEKVIEYNEKPELKLIEGNLNSHEDNAKGKLTLSKPHEKGITKQNSFQRNITNENIEKSFLDSNSKDKENLNSSPENDLNISDSEKENNDFSNEDLNKYLIYIFENKTKDNLSPGERKISVNTNLSLKKVIAIRSFLESKDIIKIDNKTTYLKTNSFDESLNLIKTKS